MADDFREPNGNGPIRNKSGQWVPGVSGNPTGEGAGRPPGSISLTTMLRRHLAHGEGRKAARLLARLVKMAEAGDMRAQELIWDRIDGKVTQPVSMDVTARPLIIEDNTSTPVLPAQDSDLLRKLSNGDGR